MNPPLCRPRCDDVDVEADRWSDALTMLAALVGLGVLVMVWPRPRRAHLSRQHHPSTPSPVSVAVDTGGARPRWRVSIASGSPTTSLDIFTWRPSGTSLPWVSEPIVEPIVLEPGSAALLDSVVIAPDAPHDVVLAWTLHRPEGDSQGSRTLLVEPDAIEPGAAPPVERVHSQWKLMLGAGLIGAALVMLALVAGWRLLDVNGQSASLPATDAVGRAGDGQQSATSSTSSPVGIVITNVPTITATTPSPTTAPPTPTPTSATTSTTTRRRTTTITSSPPTAPPTSPAPDVSVGSVTTDAVGRVVSVTGTSGECRFGSDCLIASFTLVGFAAEGDYVCEFGDGSRFAFRYVGDAATDACATSGLSITIEVDGLRSETLTRASLTNG